MLVGLFAAGAIVWSLAAVRHADDIKLIGTVDANEVLVSSKIQGRIVSLNAEEGQDVTAGQLLATLENVDLSASLQAAEANLDSERSKLDGTQENERQTRGEVTSLTANSEAQLRSTRAAFAQAQAQLERQAAYTNRTVELAREGIVSQQAKEDAVSSLQAAQAAVESARETVHAAEAALLQAHAHELQARVSERTVSETRNQVRYAQALVHQAEAQLGYAQVFAPVNGTIDVLVARRGEVVQSGGTIASMIDHDETWVYAPLPETEADLVLPGDTLRVVMPSGATVPGKVIAKSTQADFATQRDINGNSKRDIKTVQIKLRIPNAERKYASGMTAEVYISHNRQVSR